MYCRKCGKDIGDAEMCVFCGDGMESFVRPEISAKKEPVSAHIKPKKKEINLVEFIKKFKTEDSTYRTLSIFGILIAVVTGVLAFGALFASCTFGKSMSIRDAEDTYLFILQVGAIETLLMIPFTIGKEVRLAKGIRTVNPPMAMLAKQLDNELSEEVVIAQHWSSIVYQYDTTAKKIVITKHILRVFGTIVIYQFLWNWLKDISQYLGSDFWDSILSSLTREKLIPYYIIFGAYMVTTLTLGYWNRTRCKLFISKWKDEEV